METTTTGEVSEDLKFSNDSQCTLIEGNQILDTKFDEKTKFYLYKDVVFVNSLLHGHFEGLKINVKQEDIIVSSFPKAGSTWTQELIYMIFNDGKTTNADSIPIFTRCPVLELPSLSTMSIDEINADPTPKVYKSHMPYSLIPETSTGKKCKVVFICRNPKDTVVSLYYFYQMFKTIEFTGSFSEMVELFINDLVMYSPCGRIVLDYWERSKTDDNILFLKYEDLRQDLPAGVRRLAGFVGKVLNDDQVEQIAHRGSFEYMSQHQRLGHMFDHTISKFFRKGIVGDWKNHFNDEDNRKMDNWIDKTFGNTDLKFDYE